MSQSPIWLGRDGVEHYRADGAVEIISHPVRRPTRRFGPTTTGASGPGGGSPTDVDHHGRSSAFGVGGRGERLARGSRDRSTPSTTWSERHGDSWAAAPVTALSIDDLSLLETLLFYTYTTDQEHALLRAAAALLAELIERQRLVLGLSTKVIIHATASTSDAELDEVLHRYAKAVGTTALRPEKALLVLMDAWTGLKKTVGSSVELRLLDYGICQVRTSRHHGLLGNQYIRSHWLADTSFRDQLYGEARRLVRAGKPISTDDSILLHVLNASPHARQVFGAGLDRNKIARISSIDPLARIVNDAYDHARVHTATWARRP